MLPTMQPVDTSRTKRARATKSFEEVRLGSVRLYFSHFELIAFQVDGSDPVVLVPSKAIGVGTGGHVEGNRLHLEPDKEKWLKKGEFEKKWEAASQSVLK